MHRRLGGVVQPENRCVAFRSCAQSKIIVWGVVAVTSFCLSVVFGAGCIQKLLFFGWLLSKVSAFLVSSGLVVFKDYCFWGGCCQRFVVYVDGCSQRFLFWGWLLSKVSTFLLSLGMVAVKDYCSVCGCWQRFWFVCVWGLLQSKIIVLGVVTVKGFCLSVVFGTGCIQTLLFLGWLLSKVSMFLCLWMVAVNDSGFGGGCCQRFLPFCYLWGWLYSKII